MFSIQVWDQGESNLETGIFGLNDGLGIADGDTFADLHGKGLIEVVGDDAVGRRIIVVSACRLPSSQEVPQDKLLKYVG